MKFKVGLREVRKKVGGLAVVNVAAVAGGGSFQAGPSVPQVVNCQKCGGKYEMTWSENVVTGECFFEAPDSCATCGFQPQFNPDELQLSQQDICQLFGNCQ